MLDTLEPDPLYPVEYKVYSAAHNVDNHTITYDNITYAIDTPKAEDYLTLTNMTEAAYSVDVSGTTATILMKTGNPHRQNIYHTGAKVTLCVFDELHREILLESIGHTVEDAEEPTGTNDSEKVMTADGSIVVSDVPAELNRYVSRINDADDTLTLYIINATVIDIPDDMTGLIETDKTNHTTFIPVTTDENAYAAGVFREDTMVKLCVTYVTPEGDVTQRENETAFRVLDTAPKTIDGVTYYGYTLSDTVDYKFIDGLKNRDVYVSMNGETPAVGTMRLSLAPLHLAAVQYILRTDDDATERMCLYDKSGRFYMMQTSVQYNPYQLMFDEYVDDTYSVSDSHFDHDILKHMWVSPTEMHDIWTEPAAGSQDDGYARLYLYRDRPVTVGTGRYMVVRPGTGIPQIEPGCRVKWRWLSYGLEDRTNWRDNKGTMDRMLLFESTNRVLSVSPVMLGPQFIELYCMDRYGNVISNTGGGNVMVETEESTEKMHTIVG